MTNVYYEKYLKYKNKYLELKSLQDGGYVLPKEQQTKEFMINAFEVSGELNPNLKSNLQKLTQDELAIIYDIYIENAQERINRAEEFKQKGVIPKQESIQQIYNLFNEFKSNLDWTKPLTLPNKTKISKYDLYKMKLKMALKIIPAGYPTFIVNTVSSKQHPFHPFPSIPENQLIYNAYNSPVADFFYILHNTNKISKENKQILMFDKKFFDGFGYLVYVNGDIYTQILNYLIDFDRNDESLNELLHNILELFLNNIKGYDYNKLILQILDLLTKNKDKLNQGTREKLSNLFKILEPKKKIKYSELILEGISQIINNDPNFNYKTFEELENKEIVYESASSSKTKKPNFGTVAARMGLI